MRNVLTRLLNRETVSYLIVGGITTVIAWGLFVLTQHAGTGAIAANNMGNGAAMLFAFFANKIFVFRAHSWQSRQLAREALTFFSARLLTHVLETLALFVLVDRLGLPGFLMKGLTMAVIQVGGNYALSKWVVFVKK